MKLYGTSKENMLRLVGFMIVAAVALPVIAGLIQFDHIKRYKVISEIIPAVALIVVTYMPPLRSRT
ncbi:MAG: hypothetical protein WC788_00860 [Candidatus Paceibacterota bacterium]|jgi:hypothetical protein